MTNPLTATLVKGSRTGYLQTEWKVSDYFGPESKTPSISGDTLTIPAGAYGAFTVMPSWNPIKYSIKYKVGGVEYTKLLTYIEPVGEPTYS